MELGHHFTVRHGLTSGVGRGYLRSPGLAAPFHAVRSLSEPVDIRDRCRAYSQKMRPDAVFTSVTAARLWGIPLAAGTDLERVEVSVPHTAPRPMGRGVRGMQHDPRSTEVTSLDGVRVLSPASTWVSLGRVLDVPDLVAAGDFLVTPAFGTRRAAACSIDDLRRVLGLGRRIGAERLRRALDLVRVGPLSRPESLARVLFLSAGLPEGVANLRVSPLLMFDLAWPPWRVAFDYHGAHHRSASQHARDVRRLDLARDDGWSLLQATQDDLFAHPFDLVGRLRGRLIERGAAVRRVHPSQMARLWP